MSIVQQTFLASGAQRTSAFLSKHRPRVLIFAYIFIVVLFSLVPVVVHDRVEESVARQEIVANDYTDAKVTIHHIWLPLLTPAEQVKLAIQEQSPTDLDREVPVSAATARLHVIMLTLAASLGFLLLCWALLWSNAAVARFSRRWIISLSVVCSAALGWATYLYVVTPGVFSAVPDTDVLAYTLAVGTGCVLCAAIVRLQWGSHPISRWWRISAGFFLLTAALFVANRWAASKDYVNLIESLQFTPGFTMVTTPSAPPAKELAQAPSYYFSFSQSPAGPSVNNTFFAYLKMNYSHGDFSDSRNQTQFLGTAKATYVPRCVYRVSSELTSPDLMNKELNSERVLVDPTRAPASTASGAAKWSWLVVGSTAGQHYLGYIVRLSVEGGPTRSCHPHAVFPVSETAALVPLSGGFALTESMATAVIPAILGVVSALIGFWGSRRRTSKG